MIELAWLSAVQLDRGCIGPHKPATKSNSHFLFLFFSVITHQHRRSKWSSKTEQHEDVSSCLVRKVLVRGEVRTTICTVPSERCCASTTGWIWKLIIDEFNNMFIWNDSPRNNWWKGMEARGRIGMVKMTTRLWNSDHGERFEAKQEFKIQSNLARSAQILRIICHIFLRSDNDTLRATVEVM